MKMLVEEEEELKVISDKDSGATAVEKAHWSVYSRIAERFSKSQHGVVMGDTSNVADADGRGLGGEMDDNASIDTLVDEPL